MAISVVNLPDDPEQFWPMFKDRVVQCARYPGRGSSTGMSCVALGLFAKVGEVCSLSRNALLDDGNTLTDNRQTLVAESLEGVIEHWALVVHELELDTLRLTQVDELPGDVIRAPDGLGTPTALVRDAMILGGYAAWVAECAVAQLDGDVRLQRREKITFIRHLSGLFYAAKNVARDVGRELDAVAVARLQRLLSRQASELLQRNAALR